MYLAFLLMLLELLSGGKWKSFPSDSHYFYLRVTICSLPIENTTLSASASRVMLSEHVINCNIHNNT